MSQEPIDVTFVEDRDFFQFRCEVMSLPLRKRAKWHGDLFDTNGVKHRVRFVNGEFVIQHKSTLVLVKPEFDRHYNDIVSFESPDAEEQHERINRARENGGYSAALAEHVCIIQETATGNHKSKPHKVKVPTKAGEPVRA